MADTLRFTAWRWPVMTETLRDMGPGMASIEPVVPESLGFTAARENVRAARPRGMTEADPGALLKR